MATLYVNATGGDDSRSYATAQNSSTPWATIGRAAWGNASPASVSAAAAAQAGDTVLIAAGTYTTTGRTLSDRWDVALNPENSGSSGNPITFRAVGTVTIHLASGYTCPTIGAYDRDYIVWDGVTINEALSEGKSTDDTASVTISQSTGSQIINCSLNGDTNTRADNHSAIRLELVTSTLIKNNTITGVHFDGSPSQNHAAIITYDSATAIIEHNDISDCDAGVYIKGDHESDGFPSDGNIIRYNRIYDIDVFGIRLGAAHEARVYQNIIKGSQVGIQIANQSSTTEPDQATDIVIQNNTIVSTNQANDQGYSSGATTNHSNIRVYNNIFYGSFSEAVNFGDAATTAHTWEHNVYYGYDVWGSYGGSQRTFANWQSSGKDSVSPAALNAQDPLFVNETDYKLQSGSPARDLGIDILNLSGGGTSASVHAGAYITGNEVIGLESSSSGGTLAFFLA